MSEASHEHIYADLTTAFDEACRRRMSPEARHALREFIRVAVVKGIAPRPEIYQFYGEYLKCRFRHIAEIINQVVARDEEVTWDTIISTAEPEILKNYKECDDLITWPDKKEGLKLERRICEGYVSKELVPPAGVAGGA